MEKIQTSKGAKEILETTHFEFDKSSYLIDLVKHELGTYVEITQTFHSNGSHKTVRISPQALTDIIQVLKYYEAHIEEELLA